MEQLTEDVGLFLKCSLSSKPVIVLVICIARCSARLTGNKLLSGDDSTVAKRGAVKIVVLVFFGGISTRVGSTCGVGVRS
jgi:hypothetical protein